MSDAMNMIDAQLDIKFHSDFSVGGGMGDGFRADSVIARDQDGLPFLPGRALKGALREGAKVLGRCRGDLKDMVDLVFGTSSQARETNQSGLLRVSGGSLQSDLRAVLQGLEDSEREQAVLDLTQVRKQTALDGNRQVVTGSLRGIECGVAGLCFTATLRCEVPQDLDKTWLTQYLRCVCAAAKSMGGGRSRGLGEMSVTPAFAGESAAPKTITLPQQRTGEQA